jgi:tetratricopeptide (TPR) repeat protein
MKRYQILGLVTCVVAFWATSCGKPNDGATSRTIREESLPAQTDNSSLWQTLAGVADVEPGIGAAHGADVVRAMNLMKQGKLDDSERLFEATLRAFAAETNSPGRSYVSVANRAELEAFKKERPGENVVWLDYSFGQALHHLTFIAMARRDFQEALRRSDAELPFRPYAADAYIERAAVLNQLRRPTEALEAYRTAAGVAEHFSSSVNQRAVALRGIGFTQVELGDYKSARTAIEASLALEPGNEIALGELEYIGQMEQQQAAETKRPNEASGDDGK